MTVIPLSGICSFFYTAKYKCIVFCCFVHFVHMSGISNYHFSSMSHSMAALTFTLYYFKAHINGCRIVILSLVEIYLDVAEYDTRQV